MNVEKKGCIVSDELVELVAAGAGWHERRDGERNVGEAVKAGSGQPSMTDKSTVGEETDVGFESVVVVCGFEDLKDNLHRKFGDCLCVVSRV